MVAVEVYADKVGAQDGVKLEDEIWITADGPVLITHYPFEKKTAWLTNEGYREYWVTAQAVTVGRTPPWKRDSIRGCVICPGRRGSAGVKRP